MYPNIKQIKDLLTLPREIAIETALNFASKLSEDLKNLSERAKLLELVMAQLMKKQDKTNEN